MRVRVMLFLAVAYAAGVAIGQDKETRPAAPPPANAASNLPEGLPEELGFYHKTDHGWEIMHESQASKTELKRGGFTQWTGIGVGGLHQKLDYKGPRAQCQIAQSRPAFYVRMADPSHIQNLIIVRFQEKKDLRQIESAEIAANESASKAKVYSVTVKRLSPEVFVVTPESDLPTGEYILSESTYATVGYDFGIRATPSIPN